MVSLRHNLLREWKHPAQSHRNPFRRSRPTLPMSASVAGVDYEALDSEQGQDGQGHSVHGTDGSVAPDVADD